MWIGIGIVGLWLLLERLVFGSSAGGERGWESRVCTLWVDRRFDVMNSYSG